MSNNEFDIKLTVEEVSTMDPLMVVSMYNKLRLAARTMRNDRDAYRNEATRLREANWKTSDHIRGLDLSIQRRNAALAEIAMRQIEGSDDG